MTELTQEKCVACRADAPKVTDAEIAELRPKIPEWELAERDGIPRLERMFRFKNFAEALAFTLRVTHKIRGLHRNDFIMAAKTDQVYAQK